MKKIKFMMLFTLLAVFMTVGAQEVIYPNNPANAVRNIIPAETQHTLGTTGEYVISRQNAANAGNFWVQTFDGQSYHVQGVWELPTDFDSNTPGYYKLIPNYTLPEGVINVWGFEPIRWLIILNEDRTKPINNAPLTIQGATMPTVKVPVGYTGNLARDLANMQAWARSQAGFAQYRINLSDVEFPDFTVEGSYVVEGQWQQLFSHVPLLQGMEDMPPTFLLEVEGAVLLVNINTATFDELQTVNGIGSVLAGRIIAARPFTDKNDMINKVSGIGKNNGEKIAKQVTFDSN